MKSDCSKHQYDMTCPMVFKPDGLIEYFLKGQVDRQLLCTNNIQTHTQKIFIEKLTNQSFELSVQTDEHYRINTATDTVRQNKFAFIKSLMKQAAATDQGQIMKFVHTSDDQKLKKEWTVTYRSTPNIKALISDAAAEINSETRITPIWQQIAEKKKKLLNVTGTTYWDINTSLDIFDEWCTFHQIDNKTFAKDLFNVCHKILPKINVFHIQGPTTSGKTYILKSIVDGLLNCGTIRTEKSDSFCFGSCADKSLIYTDELWFTKENVELAKCVLEGSKVLVNVKHQSERLIERTPSLSTSNSDIWNVVPHEEQPLRQNVYI